MSLLFQLILFEERFFNVFYERRACECSVPNFMSYGHKIVIILV